METHEEVLTRFNKGSVLFVTFDIQTREIVQYADRSASWDEFLACLPSNECRYFVVNVDHVSSTDGVTRTKPGFGLWCPSDAPGKQKMITTFFCAEFLAMLEPFIGGIKATRIEAGTHASLDRESVIEKLFRYSRVK
jgi:hypothetical protein